MTKVKKSVIPCTLGTLEWNTPKHRDSLVTETVTLDYYMMKAGPVNGASQRLWSFIKLFPWIVLGCLLEWAKETDKCDNRRWAQNECLHTKERTTITNECTTSITVSVIDKGTLSASEHPAEGLWSHFVWCYTAAGRHVVQNIWSLFSPFFFSFFEPKTKSNNNSDRVFPNLRCPRQTCAFYQKWTSNWKKRCWMDLPLKQHCSHLRPIETEAYFNLLAHYE